MPAPSIGIAATAGAEPQGSAAAQVEARIAGDGGNTRRAIDLREGVEIDADAFIALVRAAVILNLSV